MSSNSALRLLLVEPDDDLRSILATLLEESGVIVATARTGLEALESFKACVPDVVLTEIGLDGVHGLTLGLLIRALPCFKDSVLIAHTGYYVKDIEPDIRVSGFDQVLFKPVPVETLMDVLATLAESRGYKIKRLTCS